MEARSHPRLPLQGSVWCESGGTTTETFAVNISRVGLLVSGPKLPKVGSLVNLRFSLGEAEQIELRGLVRHQVHGCGVEFVEVLPDHQMKLIAYLDRFDENVSA